VVEGYERLLNGEADCDKETGFLERGGGRGGTAREGLRILHRVDLDCETTPSGSVCYRQKSRGSHFFSQEAGEGERGGYLHSRTASYRWSPTDG
jgi:hypothetical protein